MGRSAWLPFSARRSEYRPDFLSAVDIQRGYSAARFRILRIKTLIRSVENLSIDGGTPHNAAGGPSADLFLPDDFAFLIWIQCVEARLVRGNDDLLSAR